MTTKERVKRWRDELSKPDFPDKLFDLHCGAKTRAGSPCKMKAIYMNGRCKLHGGLSTGPITKAGKRRVTLNLPNRANQTS